MKNVGENQQVPSTICSHAVLWCIWATLCGDAGDSAFSGVPIHGHVLWECFRDKL